ncbi:predicted protein [Streptomyces sp. SPB78]|nr:predicted protein [Streptomyces sp. SPB78]
MTCAHDEPAAFGGVFARDERVARGDVFARDERVAGGGGFARGLTGGGRWPVRARSGA